MQQASSMADSGKCLRIGLVGCGLWGRNLFRDLLAAGADVWVIDPAESARAFANGAGASGTGATASDLPTDLDGIVVATPASTHYAVVKALLDRGLPVFCEKPFTLDLAEAEELASVGGDRLFVLHVWRYHPAVLAIKRIHEQGGIGALTWLRSSRVNGPSPRTDCDPVWTLLPHDLSLILELTGDLPPVSHAVVEKQAGMPVGMVVHLQGQFPCIVETSTRYLDKRREIRLHGEQGTLAYQDSTMELRMARSGDDPDGQVVAFQNGSALQRQVAAIVDYLCGSAPPSSGMADALLIARRMAEVRSKAGI